MREILEYTSYRQYIADYYADKKAKSAFTWQEFANEAGFSSRVYLKYVSEGRFNLSDSAAARVADAMRLFDYEREYFTEMVKFDHAKTDSEKKAAFSKMLAIDAFFLNEDRHTNNLSVIRNEKTGKYRLSPIYDNGLSLLSDLHDYPLEQDIYSMIARVQAKPFDRDFDLQTEAAEILFRPQLNYRQRRQKYCFGRS